MGVGSASIMLIFAVLCLTVFALISLSVAETDKTLVDTEAVLVSEYYAADELAERILSVITDSYIIPDEILGVSISTDWDWDLAAEIAEYSCRISDVKELNVKIAVSEDSYDIVSWKMVNTGDWEIDESLNVWTGEGDFGFGFLFADDDFEADW